MDEDRVRASAQAVGDALVAGNIEGAIEHLSAELRRNLGVVVAMLPLPATEATVESVERGGSSVVVVVRVVSETDEVQLQTRWKDRDGEPKIVEVSHLSRTERAGEAAAAEGEAEEGGAEGPETA
jgi:succinyl-CoA synthetase alpha subunit